MEEYQAWVRPTASHVRSKKVVDEARTKLCELADSLTASLSEQDTAIQAQLEALEVRLLQVIRDAQQKTTRSLANQMATAERSHAVAAEAVTKQVADDLFHLRLSLHSSQVDAIECMQLLGDHISQLGKDLRLLCEDVALMTGPPSDAEQTVPARPKRSRRAPRRPLKAGDSAAEKGVRFKPARPVRRRR